MTYPQKVVPVTPSHNEHQGMKGVFSLNDDTKLKLITILLQVGRVRVYYHPKFTSQMVGEMNATLQEMKYPWIIRPEYEGIPWAEQCLILVHREQDLRVSTTC